MALHRVAGVGDLEGLFLWNELEYSPSISQPATGPVVSLTEGQDAQARPDSRLMQAAACGPAATGGPAKLLAAAAAPSGGQKQHRGYVDLLLIARATQRKLMVWELKRPSVIPVAQQGAPDAVDCWKVSSGDAPHCTSMPDRWGSCWSSHQRQALDL